MFVACNGRHVCRRNVSNIVKPCRGDMFIEEMYPICFSPVRGDHVCN